LRNFVEDLGNEVKFFVGSEVVLHGLGGCLVACVRFVRSGCTQRKPVPETGPASVGFLRVFGAGFWAILNRTLCLRL
jgi:hypothetical protein